MRAVFGFLILTLSLAAAADDSVAAAAAREARSWRTAHEQAIVQELMQFVALPNIATSLPDMDRNADALAAMLRKRGLTVRILRVDNAPPLVVADLPRQGAKRTIAFYAHFDGQPVLPSEWKTPPFEPVLKPEGALTGESRIYGRSSSDDKGPIVAMLAALDALANAGVRPAVNLRFVFEGEEERGSPHLGEYFARYPRELAADTWIIGDGPVHPSRRMLIFFGARGITEAEITTYGATRPLHSGNYGNWAVNPIVTLAHLIATMRDDNGRILIPHFYDNIRPLTPAEREALAAAPAIDADLRRELALGRTEGEPHPLGEQVLAPGMNLRGIAGGHVGAEASNAIPTEATASVDFRLVPDQTPDEVRRRVEEHLTGQGFFIVRDTPDTATRLAHPKVVKIVWGSGYPPSRTALDLPVSKEVRGIVAAARGEDPVVTPSLGGSVPMYLFARGGTPVIGVPIVNHDNRQHTADENLRLQNLWDGIEVYAALFAAL
jgi:acetylornithine deacetylase/succinyl-diaminopimelate desuccinylase-like protein